LLTALQACQEPQIVADLIGTSIHLGNVALSSSPASRDGSKAARGRVNYLLLPTNTPAMHEESPVHFVIESNVSIRAFAPTDMVLLMIAAAPS
jgi:hypothetical protein